MATEFSGKNGGIIIAVTDGIEECNRKPVETIEALQSADLRYLELNVLGFALKDATTRAMMAQLAKAGGGRYFDAADGQALTQALKEAMAAKYTARDATNRVVAQGTIDGADVTIPAGYYNVAIAAAGSPIQVRDVRVESEHVTTVRVNKVGREVDVVSSQPVALAEMRKARNACGITAIEGDDARRTARVQAKLNQLGFDAGPADNQLGPKTLRAIAAFAEKYGLSLVPKIDLRLEQHLDCVIAVGGTYLAAAQP